MGTISVAVPRKGRPLEAILDRIAAAADPAVDDLIDDVVSTLRYEKAVAKGETTPDRDVYARLSDYSDLTDSAAPEYTLIRDARAGYPRRIVFDSLTVEVDGTILRLIGRDEPVRALRTHDFAFGFDSADLLLEEVVDLGPEPIAAIDELNERIDPLDSDVRVVGGLGDTVDHRLLATEAVLVSQGGPLDRSFVRDYGGPFCISPRYERLVAAILGTHALDDIEFVYPDGRTEEAAIADAGLGAYMTVTGGTAREHGLVLGEALFPSETVLLANAATSKDAAAVRELVGDGHGLARAFSA